MPPSLKQCLLQERGWTAAEGSCREKRTPTESLGSSIVPGAALLSIPGQFAGCPHGPEAGDSIHPIHLLVCVEIEKCCSHMLILSANVIAVLSNQKVKLSGQLYKF